MRRLLYVPVIHAEADMGGMAPAIESESAALCGEARWAKHKEVVARFWESLAQFFSALEAPNLRIYQDGLPVDGELGRRVVEEAARRGSQNHQIILDLLRRGAELRKAESAQLLKAEFENLADLARSRSGPERASAQARYKRRRDRLDLLYGLHKATVAEEGSRKLITFSKDMQHWEINDYQGYLPQTVKYQRRGNTIIVENPKEFDRWLGR